MGMAEREEATPLRRLLFHNNFLSFLNFRTIIISQD